MGSLFRPSLSQEPQSQNTMNLLGGGHFLLLQHCNRRSLLAWYILIHQMSLKRETKLMSPGMWHLVGVSTFQRNLLPLSSGQMHSSKPFKWRYTSIALNVNIPEDSLQFFTPITKYEVHPTEHLMLVLSPPLIK